ncbi:MAG: O-antigen ligase family protein [Anaerolineae bacterium]|nr:O-antigen ligase family protein [Anaerolineae bacterium]
MRSQTPLRVILTLLVVYFSTFGLTFNGILIPELRYFTLIILLGGLGAWFASHWRGGWVWHRTPLDLLLVLWVVAMGISLLANLDMWRRSATGLWFVAGYLLFWYMLADWLANGRLSRQTLIDACMMSGLVIVFFGYVQFLTALGRGDVARVGSLVGNPNSLGAFLLLLLTFVVGRGLSLKNRLGRRLLWGYALIVAVLLGITFSRGAWLGGATSLMVLAGLSLPQNTWGKIPKRVKMMGVAVIVIVAIGSVFILVRSSGLAGRSVDLRTDIYADALQIFAKSPIIGHGLFTFGSEFALMQSQPPKQPHSHAHNGVLLVMAELGVMGLVVLIATIGTSLWLMRINWRNADTHQRRFLAIGIAGAVGFGVHHLLDFPAMMPLIAFCGLIPLALALVPYQSQPLLARWRLVGHPIAMLIASIGFIVFGVWASLIYGQYADIVRRPFAQDADITYWQAADALQTVIDADPAMTWYRNQQAYLYALGGDFENAIRAYEIVVSQEPTHSISWANLAHTYWQMGQFDRAIDAQRQATRIAPESALFLFTLGTYLEAHADIDQARQAYQQALIFNAPLWQEWDDTPLRQNVLSEHQFSDSHKLILELDNGISDNLSELWQNSAYSGISATYTTILRLMVALRTGESVDNAKLMAQAKSQSASIYDESWVLLGEAEIARFEGDSIRANDLIRQANERLAPQFSSEDVSFATNIPYFQFLVTGIPRQLLPDMFYPIQDAILRRLLD